MLPRPTIEAFDLWLDERSIDLEAVVVGGSALALLGIVDRPTRDFDILDPELPEDIVQAAQGFAAKLRGDGVELADDWFNNGPIQLVDVLPEGWQRRTQPVFSGTALRLMTLGRADLLKTKLFALCDRGTDLNDCIALAPSSAELVDARAWLIEQDASPSWPDHARSVLDDLQERLNHGV